MEYCFLVQHASQELSDVRTYGFGYGQTPFEFEPGQALTVSLPDYPGEESTLTISSSPTLRSHFEVTVKHAGDFGAKFYDTIKVGDMVSMRQPTGDFRIIPDDPRPLCFLGRDHAIPAARSFYHYLADTKSSREFTLFHELSNPEQQLYHFEFNQPRLDHFHYRLTLDQPERPPNWNGTLGPVTAEILSWTLPQLADTAFYVAGIQKDVDYFREQLAEANVPASQVFCDYWS